jgi:hypothetical protein
MGWLLSEPQMLAWPHTDRHGCLLLADMTLTAAAEAHARRKLRALQLCQMDSEYFLWRAARARQPTLHDPA